MNQVNDALENFTEEMTVDLASWKVILNDKKRILEKMDEEILAYLRDEDKTEKEIFTASNLRSEYAKNCCPYWNKVGKVGGTVQPV